MSTEFLKYALLKKPSSLWNLLVQHKLLAQINRFKNPPCSALINKTRFQKAKGRLKNMGYTFSMREYFDVHISIDASYPTLETFLKKKVRTIRSVHHESKRFRVFEKLLSSCDTKSFDTTANHACIPPI